MRIVDTIPTPPLINKKNCGRFPARLRAYQICYLCHLQLGKWWSEFGCCMCWRCLNMSELCVAYFYSSTLLEMNNMWVSAGRKGFLTCGSRVGLPSENWVGTLTLWWSSVEYWAIFGQNPNRVRRMTFPWDIAIFGSQVIGGGSRNNSFTCFPCERRDKW